MKLVYLNHYITDRFKVVYANYTDQTNQ